MKSGAVMLMLALIPASKAGACSCREMSVKDALQGASAVFVGTADSIEIVVWPKTGQMVQVRFHVLCSWKGPRGDSTVDVYTSPDDGTCGYRFARGETYLVYAEQRAEGRPLGTGSCHRTRLFRRGGDDVESLGRPVSAVRGWSLPKTGTVMVTIGRREANPAWMRMPGTSFVSIENAVVRLNGSREGLRTDRLGMVEFRDVAPGRFVLEISAVGWVQQRRETVSVGAGKFVERWIVLSPKGGKSAGREGRDRQSD